jgi:nicotinamide-nucleotide amidase
MSTLHIAILSTGDELVEGMTLNTNAKAISSILFAEGLRPGLQLTCGDKEQEIIEGLTYLAPLHDYVILTGGLGPTSDDRTRFALGKFLNHELVSKEEVLNHIQKLTNRNIVSTGDHQQSLFPQEALLFPNPYGTALGCMIETQPCSFVMLPGPPRECLPMFHDHLLPQLVLKNTPNRVGLSWLAFGVREETLAAQLDKVLHDFPHCETGYRLDPPYVECKVRCRPEDVKKITALVAPLLEPYLLTGSNLKASDALKGKLFLLKKTFTIKDTATGGLLQNFLSTPLTYPYLQFGTTDDFKADFECEGLEAYWQQQNEATENEIRFKSHFQNKIIETKMMLPFKSVLVINMAAEWICAQILMALP